MRHYIFVLFILLSAKALSFFLAKKKKKKECEELLRCKGYYRNISRLDLVCTRRLGLEVIKKFMLNSAEHEFFPAHKC